MKNIKIKSIYLFLSFSLLTTAYIQQALGAKSAFERENFYSDKICKEVFDGQPTRTKEGLYIDCETNTMAMEFDWAKRPKNYECIGQAIVYSVQTGKLPTCVLLARTQKEYDFGNKQFKYMQRAGVYLIVYKIY